MHPANGPLSPARPTPGVTAFFGSTHAGVLSLTGLCPSHTRTCTRAHARWVRRRHRARPRRVRRRHRTRRRRRPRRPRPRIRQRVPLATAGAPRPGPSAHSPGTSAAHAPGTCLAQARARPRSASAGAGGGDPAVARATARRWCTGSGSRWFAYESGKYPGPSSIGLVGFSCCCWGCCCCCAGAGTAAASVTPGILTNYTLLAKSLLPVRRAVP
ncbi:hypothetical protein B0H11DRAFT_48696 [Mycena galericulata]|nr:hypothetical protein B0H11DRAFT_48696 [Mycena galericulata]